MANVEATRGAIETTNLGRVLMHEHVFVLSTEIRLNYPEEWGDEDARVNHAIQRLSELKAAGIDTILDPAAIGLGRYIPRIASIAAQIDLNIVVATGMYTFDVLAYYFRRRTPGSGPGDSDPIVEMFVRDITQGIADTGVKAGVLK
jgi:phosphotriesterase-related protein